MDDRLYHTGISKSHIERLKKQFHIDLEKGLFKSQTERLRNVDLIVIRWCPLWHCEKSDVPYMDPVRIIRSEPIAMPVDSQVLTIMKQLVAEMPPNDKRFENLEDMLLSNESLEVIRDVRLLDYEDQSNLFINHYKFNGEWQQILFPTKREEKRCDFCFKFDAPAICGQCRQARYCSIDCQTWAWPQHKKTCAKKSI